MPKVRKDPVVLRYVGGVYVGVPSRDLTAMDVEDAAKLFNVSVEATRSILITSGHYARAPTPHKD